MVTNKAMHDFAVKYHNLYINPQTTERDVESTFADECFTPSAKLICPLSCTRSHGLLLMEQRPLSASRALCIVASRSRRSVSIW